jgi:hypothetical protein
MCVLACLIATLRGCVLNGHTLPLHASNSCSIRRGLNSVAAAIPFADTENKDSHAYACTSMDAALL